MDDVISGSAFANSHARSLFLRGREGSPPSLVTSHSDLKRHTNSQSHPALQPAPSISLNIATNDRDRGEAYRLIHEAYAAAGYMDGSEFSIPESYDSPHSRTFLLTRDGDPCGTFTFIPDNPLGLVMEPIYAQELAAFRGSGRFLGEVSGLAIDKGLTSQERSTALLYLYEVAYLFCRRTGITDLLIAVNPHHAAFYERSLLFDSFAEFRTYTSLKEAPAVAKRLHMPSWPNRLYAKYGRPEEARPQRFPMDSLLRVLVAGMQDCTVPPGLDVNLFPSLVAPQPWTHPQSDYSGPPPHPLLTAGTSAA